MDAFSEKEKASRCAGKFEWLAGQCRLIQMPRLNAMPGRHSLELSRSQDVVGALGEALMVSMSSLDLTRALEGNTCETA